MLEGGCWIALDKQMHKLFWRGLHCQEWKIVVFLKERLEFKSIILQLSKYLKKKKKKEFTLLFKKLNGYKNINYASHQNV